MGGRSEKKKGERREKEGSTLKFQSSRRGKKNFIRHFS